MKKIYKSLILGIFTVILLVGSIGLYFTQADNSEIYTNDSHSIGIQVERHLEEASLVLVLKVIDHDESLQVETIKVDGESLSREGETFSYETQLNGTISFTVPMTYTLYLEAIDKEVVRDEMFIFDVIVDELEDFLTEDSMVEDIQSEDEIVTPSDEILVINPHDDIKKQLDQKIDDKTEVIFHAYLPNGTKIEFNSKAAISSYIAANSGFEIKWDHDPGHGYGSPMITATFDGKVNYLYCMEPYATWPNGEDYTMARGGSSGIRAILNNGFPTNESGLQARYGKSDEQAYVATFIAINAYLNLDYDRATIEAAGDGYVNALLAEADKGYKTLAIETNVAQNTSVYNKAQRRLESEKFYQITNNKGITTSFTLSGLPTDVYTIDGNGTIISSIKFGQNFKLATNNLKFNQSFKVSVKHSVLENAIYQFTAPGVQTLVGFGSVDPLVQLDFNQEFVPAVGDLEVHKKNNFDELMPGVVYEFSEYADMRQPFATITTDENSNALAEDILTDTVVYYREKSTIIGHLLDTTIFNATIEAGETIKVDRTNIAIEGQGKLIKTDGDRKFLEDVVFGLYKANGTLIREFTTDANGEILTPLLRYGDYYFQEHKTWSDRWKDDTKIPFSIREHLEVKHVTAANTLIQTHLEWNKVNEDGLPLEGVGFSIRDIKTGELVTLSYIDGKDVIDETVWYTDVVGKVFVRGLIGAGEYELIEVVSLDGYQPVKPIRFIIDNEQSFIDLGTILGKSLDVGQIVNQWNRGNLVIEKLDIDTKESLAGFTFNLYDDEETLIGTYITGEDGIVTIEDLKYGTYEVEEIAAEGDYGIDLNHNRQSIFIKEHGKTYTVTFENKHAAIQSSASFHERDIDKVSLVDVISYTDLKPDKEYIIKGVLLDKLTGEIIEIDGEPITGLTVFTPTEKDGVVEVIFSFDINKLQAQTIVVFQDLYDEERLVTSHHDLDDIDQTLEVLTVRINKQDSSSKANLKNAEFTMTNLSQQALESKVTDDEGIAEFKMIEGEVAEFKETRAPEGYGLSDEVVLVSATADMVGNVYTQAYFNDPLEVAKLPETGMSVSKVNLFGFMTVLVGSLFILTKQLDIEDTENKQ